LHLRSPVDGNSIADSFARSDIVRQVLATVLSVLIFQISTYAQAAPPRLSIQQQMIVAPKGEVVEVRTFDKQKIRGRLRAVSENSFEVVYAKGSQLEARQFAYSEVKSVKIGHRSAAQTVGWVLLGGLAALGVLTVVLIIAVAAGDS
jgi:hypothetical protein